MESTQIRMLQMISGMILKDKAKSQLILKIICAEPLKVIFEKSNTEVVWACREQKKAPAMARKIVIKGKKKGTPKVLWMEILRKTYEGYDKNWQKHKSGGAAARTAQRR